MKRSGHAKHLICSVFFVLAAIACFIALPSPAHADDETADLKARLETLEREMADIKKALAAKETAAAKPAGLEFSGRAYLAYELDMSGDAADTNSLPRKSDSEFEHVPDLVEVM